MPFLNHNSCDNNCDNSYNLTPTIVDVIVVKEQLIVDQFSANSWFGPAVWLVYATPCDLSADLRLTLAYIWVIVHRDTLLNTI